MIRLNEKKRTIILVFINIALILTNSINGFSQVAHITNFKKEEYKGASENWSITRSKDDIVYIGNNTGLIEFDGVSWELHSSQYYLKIRAVCAGFDGKIYSGGYRELGYWEKNNKGELLYHSLTPLIEDQFQKNEEFWNIISIGKKVYFQSFDHVFIYESGKFTRINPQGFISYSFQSGNKVLFAVWDSGIFSIENNTYKVVAKSDFFKGKFVRFFLELDKSDDFIIGTESNGMYRYYAKEGKFKIWAPHLKDYFSTNRINHGIQFNRNKIIIGTILDGIIVIDLMGNVVSKLNTSDGLQNNTILGINLDKDKNIWLSLNDGIDLISFSPNPSFIYNETNEIGAIYTGALLNETLYLGTNQGLYKKEISNENDKFSIVPKTQEQVWNCKVIDSTLFVGHTSGTFAIQNGHIKRISEIDGGYSICRVPESPDLLVQSTYNELVVYKKKNSYWEFSHTIKGFYDLIKCIEFDYVGNLWASHRYLGTFKLRLNNKLDSVVSIRQYRMKTEVFNVENRVVFATGEKFYTYDDINDSIVPYQLFNEQLKEYKKSTKIIKSDEHCYWFICKTGIAFYNIVSNNINKIKEYPIELFRGFIPRHENIIPLYKNKAIAGMEHGYAILNTKLEDQGNSIIDKKLKIRKMASVDNEGNIYPIHLDNKKIKLPYIQNSLLIKFSFPHFIKGNIKYQYKIEGFNNKWSEPENKPIFNLKRIPSGDYTLKVVAINNWGKKSKVFSLDFSVSPPWFRTKYAYFFYTAFLIALIMMIRYFTIKRVELRERKKRLKKERELIQLRNEKLRGEIQLKSQQLASSTLGIIKKNEFLLSLKEKLRKQKEALGTRYPDKYYQSIANKIDEHISGQDDWNLFEANFEMAHETFLINLKSSCPELTPKDLRLCAYLRINLSSKEIAPLLGITVRAVENQRYRLRKKLQLDSDKNLTEYILSIN